MVMDMDHPSVPLNPLRVFAIASRHRTFTAAARQLGVSQIAVSRQIAVLEGYLGVKLFKRGPRSVILTEAGRNFSQQVTGPIDELEQVTRRFRSQESEKTVELRVYPSFAHYWLLPRLSDLTSRHPSCELRFDTRVEPLDFRGTQIDVAIQLGHGDWRDARCRKLFDEVVDVVGSPAYAQGLPPADDGNPMKNARLLHARYRRREWAVWSAAAGIGIDDCEGVEFDSSVLAYSAAQNGFGLAIGQVELLRESLKKKELVQPFEKPVKTGAAFYVIWPTTRSVARNTRNVIDWLLSSAGHKPEFDTRRAT